MATVYIIYSPSIDTFYIGSCLDLEKRLHQHRTHFYDFAFTRRASDWEVYFKIEDLDLTVAREIESHIKRMKSRVYLSNLKKYPEMSERLLQQYRF